MGCRAHYRGWSRKRDLLSRREWQVLHEMVEAAGKDGGQMKLREYVGERLGVTLKTMDTHLRNIRAKLNLHSQAAMVYWWFNGGADKRPNE